MIKIYTTENCKYCKKLKNMLDEEKITYDEVNVDLDENKTEYEKMAKITESDMVPLILIKKQALVPEVSFNSIDEAVTITKKLLKN